MISHLTMHSRRPLFLLALVLALPALAQPARPPAVVDVALPQHMPMPHELHLVGSLAARKSIELAAQVAGQIKTLAFTDGQKVEAGEPLVVLDEDIFRAELQQAQANLKLAELRHERSARLLKQQAVAQSAYDETRAELDERRAAIELAQVRLRKTVVNAPFSGRVGISAVAEGDYVMAGQALVSLVNADPIQLDVQVPESALAAIIIGAPMSFSIDSLGDQRFSAEVTAMEPSFDRSTRNLRVRASMPNPDESLRPGMFARATVLLGADTPVLAVPEQALMASRAGYRVYVVEDGVARLRPVATGLRTNGYVEIRDGLTAGTTVVISGQLRLNDGARVEVRQPPAQLTLSETAR